VVFSFDGKHATEYFDKVLDVKRGMSAPRSPKLQNIPGKAGAYFFGLDKDVLEFEVTVLIKGTDSKELWSRIRSINGWLLQNDLKKLVLDDEPDLYYWAVCTDKLNIDEIIETGIASFKFLVPESYAYGQTKQQRVGSASAQFVRPGIRYREDGSEVTENYPIYKEGKFGQAILVEEGTTNLLDSAANPTQEEVQVEIGQDYYLSVIDGSAAVEHKRTENLPKIKLEKEGQDINGNADWTKGTLNNTEVVSGALQLTKSGNNLNYHDTDFANGTFENTTVVQDNSGDNYVGIQILPWDYRDYMGNLGLWVGSGTRGARVLSENGTTFTRVTSALNENVGVDRRASDIVFSNGFTLDFRARVSGDFTFYISDGTVGFTDVIPQTGNQWKWFRISIQDSSKGVLYMDGEPIKNLTSISYTTQRILLGYRTSGIEGLTFDVDAVYYARSDFGPQVMLYEGDYISEEIDLSSVGNVNSITTDQTSNNGLRYSGEEGSLTIKYQIGTFDGTKTNWSGSWSDTIPLEKGEDVTNKRLKYWAHFQISDSGDTPKLFDISIGMKSGYSKTGHWESLPVDVSQVVKVSSAVQSWSEELPNGTNIQLQTRISTDGETWTEYQDTANSEQIPFIDQTTDLSNAQYQYKFILSTSDVSVTPKVIDADYSFLSGYKPELTIELPEYPVDSIGIAENSILEWVEVERPLETSVVFESSLDQTNWTTVENGGQLIPAGTDLSGKSLYLRYTLSTSDTGQTPILEPTLIWYIQQQGYKIRPATSAIRVTPDNVSRWQLEQKSYATGWHTTGTREGESLKIHVQDLIDPSDGETDGAVDLYVYEDGKSSVRYLLDTDGTYRTQIFRNENIYEFWYDGQKLAETEAPEIGWHHLGLTWDATTFWLYLDGSLVESVSVESVDLIGTVYLYIGCDKEGNNQWSSLIDDLVVSNEFKDASYFAARANSTDPSGPSLTANVYPFDNTLSAIGDSNIVYQGTAEAYPVFTITFAASVDNFRITDGDEYIQVIHNFQPNDVLVVDCENQVVRLNGASIMESIDLDSDFFSVENGDVIGIDPAGVATVDVAFTERWL
jgi:predicted phage tail component-like protein